MKKRLINLSEDLTFITKVNDPDYYFDRDAKTKSNNELQYDHYPRVSKNAKENHESKYDHNKDTINLCYNLNIDEYM